MTQVTLAGARKSAGYTQESLAEKLSISRATVSAWESGKVKIRPLQLAAFCHITGFSENDISLPEEVRNVNYYTKTKQSE